MAKTDIDLKEHLQNELHEVRVEMRGISTVTSLWKNLYEREIILVQRLRELGVDI